MTTKKRAKYYTWVGIGFIVAILLMAYRGTILASYVPDLISPAGNMFVASDPSISIELDKWIPYFADKYGTTQERKSWLRYQLSCLAHKESKHDFDKGQGDSGLAGGPFQFHESTYLSFRMIMSREGLVDYVGSRFNVKDSTETTAWALMNNKGGNWGPKMRGDCR